MRVKYAALLSSLTALCGCVNAPEEVSEIPPPPREILTVTVGPERVDCVGVAPMTCLVVDGQYFYQGFEGFDYEPGYHYELVIERAQVAAPENLPADASLYQYRLIEVVRKTKARDEVVQ